MTKIQQPMTFYANAVTLQTQLSDLCTLTNAATCSTCLESLPISYFIYNIALCRPSIKFFTIFTASEHLLKYSAFQACVRISLYPSEETCAAAEQRRRHAPAVISAPVHGSHMLTALQPSITVCMLTVL